MKVLIGFIYRKQERVFEGFFQNELMLNKIFMCKYENKFKLY